MAISKKNSFNESAQQTLTIVLDPAIALALAIQLVLMVLEVPVNLLVLVDLAAAFGLAVLATTRQRPIDGIGGRYCTAPVFFSGNNEVLLWRI